LSERASAEGGRVPKVGAGGARTVRRGWLAGVLGFCSRACLRVGSLSMSEGRAGGREAPSG
jgi:hypothetical protein